MAEISATAVRELRERTGLPMMKCKEALVANNGDTEAAVQWLKSQVKGLLEKRGENATTEGQVKILVRPDGSEAVMIEIQCESPPVATGEDMNHFADELARQLLDGPGADTPEALLSQAAPSHSGQTLNDLYEDMINRIREKIVVSRVARVKGPVFLSW